MSEHSEIARAADGVHRAPALPAHDDRDDHDDVDHDARDSDARDTRPNEPPKKHRAKKQDDDHGEDDDAEGDAHDEKKNEPPPRPLKERVQAWRHAHPKAFVGILAALAILIAAGIALFFYMRTYESTDDAEVDGNISNLSARVSGIATAVYVQDNQYVKAGQLLAEVDPSDLQVAVAQAEANLALAQSQSEAQNPSVPITEQTNKTTIATGGGDVAATSAQLLASEKDADSARSALAKAEAENRLAQIDRERSQNLVASGAISQADLDQKAAAAAASEAQVESAKAAVQAATQRIEQQRSVVGEAQNRLQEAKANAPKQVQIQEANVASKSAQVKAAQAALDQARLNLSYARILAPVSGIVGKKAVNVGDHVEPGQPLLAIVQSDDLWVTANFKETQLERMHPGERVTLSVDAFPGTFDAQVESMPGASGSKYSLFPPENATGNYVKVVQRLPVRLSFIKGQAGLDRLRPGMSVEPKVFVR